MASCGFAIILEPHADFCCMPETQQNARANWKTKNTH